HMFDMNAGYFLIQCASEDDREKVYELCGRYSRDDADGVAQVCFMGVINPLSPEVETAEDVRDGLLAAAKHIPDGRLRAPCVCRAEPFSPNVKPPHGPPDYARDVSMQKISNRLAGSKMSCEELRALTAKFARACPCARCRWSVVASRSATSTRPSMAPYAPS